PKSRSRLKRKRRALRRLRRRSGPSAAGQRVRRGNAAPLRSAAVALTRRGRSGLGQEEDRAVGFLGGDRDAAARHLVIGNLPLRQIVGNRAPVSLPAAASTD